MLRAAAQGLDAVIVNPTFVLGPSTATRPRSSIELIRQLPAAPDPRLRRRRPQHRRRPRRRRRAPARRRDGRDGRALHPRRPQLHPAAPLRRPLADQRRPGARRCGCRRSSPSAARELSEQLGLPLGLVGRRGALGVALVDVFVGEGEARARLRAAPARGDARGGAGRSTIAQLGDRVGARARSGRARCSTLAGRATRLAGRLMPR